MGKFDFIEQDWRIMEQKLRKHQLSQQEYQKLMKGLEDEKENAEELKIFDEEGQDSEES